MKKEIKLCRKYIIVTLDKPYINEVYVILKRGQMEKGPEHWPEGDINFRSWLLLTFEGTLGIDYLLKEKYMIIDNEEPYAGEIIQAIERHGDMVIHIETFPTRDTARLHIENQTGDTIDFCCGKGEYSLKPDEKITVEVRDEDCMYFDEIR